MPFKLHIYLGAFVTYCDPILVISRMPISSLNPIFDKLSESSHQNVSNKWSNFGFGEEITQVSIDLCSGSD